MLSTALKIKRTMQEKLKEFFTCHKKAVEHQKEGVMQKAKRKLKKLLKSKKKPKGTDVPAAGPEVQTMANVMGAILDNMEPNLQDSNAMLARLEELISQNQLQSLSRPLTDRIYNLLLHDKFLSNVPLAQPRKAISAPNMKQLAAVEFNPTEQVYLFVEGAVRHLLISFLPPLPSCEVDDMTNHDEVVSVCAQLMSEHVMANLSSTCAASRAQAEIEKLADELATETKNLDKETLQSVDDQDKNSKPSFFRRMLRAIKKPFKKAKKTTKR